MTRRAMGGTPVTGSADEVTSALESADGVASNLARVREQVARAAVEAGRHPDDVAILLATKTVAPEIILQALRAGATLIGENRAQEVLSKTEALAVVPHRMHFIGHLQSNKVNQLIGRIDCLETLDSAVSARRLQARLEARDSELDVMVQVNVSEEHTKSGVPVDEAPALVDEIGRLARLRLRGLMTIGLNSPDKEAVRSGYRALARLRERLVTQGRVDAADVRELSMGMSGDFADAIAEGATIVRIGSAVFGRRPGA